MTKLLTLFGFVFLGSSLGCGLETSGLDDPGPSAGGGKNGSLIKGQISPSSTGGTAASSTGGSAGPAAASGGSGGAMVSATGGAASTGGQAGSGGSGGSEVPKVVVMDDMSCQDVADGSTCMGKIAGEAEPSSGLQLAGTCRASVCCMGCWDGAVCHYFDDSACSTGAAGGGECVACGKFESCRVMLTGSRTPPRMGCF